MKNLYTCKYPKIIQSVFYLLKYRDRQQICERDTNKLSWKKAKLQLNDDLFQKLGEYWPIGPKDETYKDYEKFKWIQDAVKGVSQEEVDDYSIALGKLNQWLLLAMETRNEDVRARRQAKKNCNDQRLAAIEREKERVAKRTEAMEAKKQEFNDKVNQDIEDRKAAGSDVDPDEYKPEFDTEEFIQ